MYVPKYKYQGPLEFCIEPKIASPGVTKDDIMWMINWRIRLAQHRPDLREQIAASISYLRGWVMP